MGDEGRELVGQGSHAAFHPRTKARKKFWILTWLAFLPFVLIRSENLAESDTFWEVRTGLFTVSQGRIPSVDPFSWTVSGKPWTLNSWAFDVILGLFYDAAGLVGVALVCACLIAGIGALVLVLARQLGASPVASGWMLVIGAPLLTLFLSARPQLVDYIAVLALVVVLRRLVEARQRTPRLLAIAIITVLWVNLHAGALLGVAIVAASGLLVFLRRGTRGRAGWLLAALLITAVCSLLNPYGTGLLTQTLQVRRESAVIAEWQPFNPADPLQLIMFTLGLLGLGTAARRGDPVFTAAIGVAAGGSVAAMRILPVLVLLALPVLAALASHEVVLRYLASRRRMFAQAAAGIFVVAGGLAVFNLPFFGRPDPTHFPSSSIRVIPAGCKLFNDYQLGGLVILERPDVLVSIDSRNDLYGADRVAQSLRTVDAQGDLNKGLAGADCVLVPPTTGLARWLHTSPDWDLKSSETTAELFVRR
ncbi:MFS family permease [Sinomonas atrocyanea]|uniref:hypothetical protein n=1 Tax=Sinomonas atrocyanea TaxID=37927 RepID=UPI00278B6D17|nr:hypothetical protein [Sinomonas atrocyanea]MDQ0258712.1 MFS family permease [Sinomonas atrocyanea]